MGVGDLCPALERYSNLQEIGRGKYGKVFLATDKQSGGVVAIKRLRVNPKESYLKVREGSKLIDVPASIAVEIKVLRLLSNDHVIKLLDVIYQGSLVYLVFEYMEHDLCGIIHQRKLPVPEIKCYLKQILEGLHYCHLNGLMHRDIKSANLLVSKAGVLKLADFGMSTPIPEKPCALHCGVVTLWNRPPELLLGFSSYGPAVDMWSLGCVFAELLVSQSIFPGKDETQQLSWIFKMCGTPDEKSWPGVSKSPVYSKFVAEHGEMPRRLRKAFKNVDSKALDLLEQMLTLNPAKRITAQNALLCDYLWTDPMPCSPSELPLAREPCTEMKSRLERRDQHKPKPASANSLKRKQPPQPPRRQDSLVAKKPRLGVENRHDRDLERDRGRERDEQQQHHKSSTWQRSKPLGTATVAC